MLAFIQKLYSDTRVIPTGVKWVVLAIFLRSLGWGFVDPFYSIFVKQFTAHYAGVGSLISIMNITSLIAMLPLLRLADRVKDTTIMRDGGMVYFFAISFYFLAAMTHQLAFLVAAFICSGVAYPFFIVGAESYIRKKSKYKPNSASFSFYTALHHLGWIIGMFIASFTVQYYGLSYMFLFVLPGIFLGFFALRRIRERGLKSIFSGFTKYLHRREDFQGMLDDLKQTDRKTFFFLILAFFDGVIVMFIHIFIPLFALSLDLSLRRIALLMAITYLPFVFSFLIAEATGRLKRMNLIATGLMIGTLAFVLLSFTLGHLWVVMLTAISSLSLAIIRPAYNGMLTHLTPRRMLGEVTGLNNMVMRLGYVFGPILTGFFADQFGLQIVFILMASMAFILAMFSLLLRSLEVLQAHA